MPRPTPAQLVYGSCTVICSTLAMLLLSQTSSGIGIAVIALAALGLGLLVAMTIPLPRPHTVAQSEPVPVALPEVRVPVRRETVAAATAEPVREPTAP
ncbi:hypothetical protein [Streptomyces hyaluromycini]|uniref:hypothetical protein n=1 Tax=Streptomyces hyaluromycini TaxID=1377993 RepID=UPI000B5C3C96|nr:hypothetical protein [Streptomyces hyaluromycini]